jgi:Holliday junction DNA helicase RuvA
MIARIRGKVVEIGDNNLIIDTNGISYEVFVPTTVRERIDDNLTEDGVINLITYHYHQVEPSRSTPTLVGFLNEVEREFFEIFITVSGIGPRAALKALNQPISLIAQAIDNADCNFLRSLPGIGQQRAREVIAKLQHRVGKFCLIQDAKTTESKPATRDIEEEALAVLVQLQYRRPEALNMIRKALERSKDVGTTEELLNEVYKQKKAV